MCEQLTIYSVPGPSSSPGLLQEKIGGGWAYALEFRIIHESKFIFTKQA